MAVLSPQLTDLLPAMVHGAVFNVLGSILNEGLRPNHACNMFNMIPHFDRRSEKGQRFDKWNSLLLFNPARVAAGDPFVPARSADGQIIQPVPMPIALASSGSLNVHGTIPPEYIENIVIHTKGHI